METNKQNRNPPVNSEPKPKRSKMNRTAPHCTEPNRSELNLGKSFWPFAPSIGKQCPSWKVVGCAGETVGGSGSPQGRIPLRGAENGIENERQLDGDFISWLSCPYRFPFSKLYDDENGSPPSVRPPQGPAPAVLKSTPLRFYPKLHILLPTITAHVTDSLTFKTIDDDEGEATKTKRLQNIHKFGGKCNC